MANRPFLLLYDIPEIRRRPVYPNPSDELWDAGCVRIRWSDWLMMEDRIPYLVVNAMLRHGCEVNYFPFDAEATAGLRELALANMRREIAERLAAAEETRREALNRLDDESDGEYRKRRSAFLATVRVIERRITQLVGRVERAGTVFGITGAEIGVRDTLNTVRVMTDGLRARAEAFAQAHGILSRRGGESAGIARSMRRGEIPPAIAADFLQDLGGSDSDEFSAGNDLRESFGPSF